jgi:hypothetical protein
MMNLALLEHPLQIPFLKQCATVTAILGLKINKKTSTLS